MDVSPPENADGAEAPLGTAAAHPEEMKGTIRLTLREWATLTISGRTTPAGLLCAGVFVCGALFSLRKLLSRR